MIGVFIKLKKEVLITCLVGVSALLGNTEIDDRVVFLDVGVGDATLIQLNGKNIFIDGGPDDSVIFSLSKYLPAVNPKIDLLILSHFHSDHYAGLNEIIHRYDVGEIWVPKMCDTSWTSELISNNVKLVELASGRAIPVGSGTLQMGLPGLQDGACITVGDENNSSIVVHLDTPNKDLYFFGDIEKETERLMLKQGETKTAGIIKAAHHCSDTSSTEPFLKAVAPDLAICSTGEENSYGHPSKSVLSRFEKLGIQYRITYEEGDIVVPL